MIRAGGYDSAMTHARKRWIAAVLSVVLVAPICHLLVGLMPAADGGPGLSAILSPSQPLALAAGIFGVVLAAVGGCVGARFCGPRVGLFVMGLPLIWMALLMGRVRDVIISQADTVAAGGAMWVLAIETGVYALLALAAALAIMRCSPDWTRRDVSDPRNLSSVVGGAAAFVVTGVVVWIIARSDLPGQVIAACWIGSIFGAMAGRVVMPDASTVGLLAGALLVGVVGHAVGAVMQGGEAVTAADAGTLWGLSRPLPLVYVAAALVGVPGGSAWGKSLIGHAHRDHH